VADRRLKEASDLLQNITHILQGHGNLYYTGYVQDAQKEYTEACTFLAFAKGEPLPGPQDLKVNVPPYLNGLGEAVGELRRYILDSLRRDDTTGCEEALEVMDQVYTMLVTMDFTDALTGGLRRTNDGLPGWRWRSDG